MKLIEMDEIYRMFWNLYILKVFYDNGQKEVAQRYLPYVQQEEFLYDNFYDFLSYTAEYVDCSEEVYLRHGYREYEDEVNIWSFSCKEMQEYFKLARKIHRLEGNRGNNRYYELIYDKVERERNFYSYSFDYFFAKKQTAACLDVLWGYEFDYEFLMCAWILKVMRLFKEELTKLKERYKKVRREKRCRPKQKEVSKCGVTMKF